MPYILRAASPKMAKGAPSERPNTSKPSGSEMTRSPWLIQTWWRWPVAHRPSNSGHSFSISTKARPNSRWSEPSASPPSWTHMVICAVADAEHRHAGLEHDLRRARAAGLDGRGRPARQDHRLRLDALERRLGLLERDDLGIDAGLAHAPGDQLGDLAAEIDDEDGVGMSGAFHGGRLEKEVSRRNGLARPFATPIRLPRATIHHVNLLHQARAAHPSARRGGQRRSCARSASRSRA